MSLDSLSQINQQIGRHWFAALPSQGWDSCELFWAQAGQGVYCQTELLTGGQRQHLKFPAELHPLFSELQAAMAHPEMGAWLSIQGRAESSGAVEFFHNWDRRYFFNGLPSLFDPPQEAAPQPSDLDFLAELQRYPRAVQFWPAWLARGNQVPQFQDRVAPPAALAWTTQPGTFGWPALYEQLDECLRGQLRLMPQRSPALLGWQGEETRHAALEEVLELTLACALNVLRRSDSQVTLKMQQAWAQHTREQPGPDALADVTRVLRQLATQMIATRFELQPAR